MRESWLESSTPPGYPSPLSTGGVISSVFSPSAEHWPLTQESMRVWPEVAPCQHQLLWSWRQSEFKVRTHKHVDCTLVIRFCVGFNNCAVGEMSLCSNRGRCIDLVGYYTCFCVSAFAGNTCEIEGCCSLNYRIFSELMYQLKWRMDHLILQSWSLHSTQMLTWSMLSTWPAQLKAPQLPVTSGIKMEHPFQGRQEPICT